MFNTAISIILLLLLQTADLSSPDGRYDIAPGGRDLSDSNTELTFRLIDREEGDSLLLTRSFIHDLLSPVFWWSKDSRLLIFEHKQEGDSVSVNIYDAERGKVVFSSEGYINDWQNKRGFYIDDDNKKLLFFTRKGNCSQALMVLNMSTLKTSEMLEFQHYDVYETPKIVHFDKKARQVELLATDRNYKTTNLIHSF